MKKNILIMLALMVILPIQAQFRLTDKGFVQSDDRKLEYYIIKCPEMSKCAAADVVGYFTESRLANQWTDFSWLDCDAFTVKGVAPDAIYNGSRMFRQNYTMEYRIMFDFCDGFVRVWAPEIMGLSRIEKKANVYVSIGTNENSSLSVGHNCSDDTIWTMYVSENYRPNGARGYEMGGISIFNRAGVIKQKYAKQSLEEYFNGFICGLEQYISTKK